MKPKYEVRWNRRDQRDVQFKVQGDFKSCVELFDLIKHDKDIEVYLTRK